MVVQLGSYTVQNLSKTLSVLPSGISSVPFHSCYIIICFALINHLSDSTCHYLLSLFSLTNSGQQGVSDQSFSIKHQVPHSSVNCCSLFRFSDTGRGEKGFRELKRSDHYPVLFTSEFRAQPHSHNQVSASLHLGPKQRSRYSSSSK